MACLAGLSLAAAQSPPAHSVSPEWSPDGDRLAYSQRVDGNWEIFVANADGTDPRQITDDPAVDQFPSWSPDARRLLFVSDRDGDTELYVAELSDEVGHIAMRQLTDNSARDGEYASWRNESQFVFASDRSGVWSLYLYTLESGRQQMLSSGEFEDLWPDFAPNGTIVSFTSGRTGILSLFTMAIDGSGLHRIAPDGGASRNGLWSPDGSRLAYVSNVDHPEWEIYTIAADGTDRVRLTDNDLFDADPHWSPDGQHIAFASRRSGTIQIHVMRSDGSDVRQVTFPR